LHLKPLGGNKGSLSPISAAANVAAAVAAVESPIPAAAAVDAVESPIPAAAVVVESPIPAAAAAAVVAAAVAVVAAALLLLLLLLRRLEDVRTFIPIGCPFGLPVSALVFVDQLSTVEIVRNLKKKTILDINLSVAQKLGI
jgi:hypothetical protein